LGEAFLNKFSARAHCYSINVLLLTGNGKGEEKTYPVSSHLA